MDISEKGLTELPAIKPGTTKVDASDNAITEVKADIAGATDLEELLLFKNKIKTLDKAIGSLGKLTTLNLFNNAIMKAPPEIGNLGSLEELNMAANKMMMLADPHFAGLTSLKILTLNDNRLVRIGSMMTMKNLEEIRLYSNNLEEMPAIGACPNLTIVELNGNRITTIPDDWFSKAPKLEKFQIHKNMLTAVPATITSCAGLVNVQVQDNKLSALPDGKWPETMETLFCQGNPDMKALPPGLTGMKSIKRLNVGSAGVDKLAEDLKKMVLSKGPQAMFWGADGACQTGS